MILSLTLVDAYEYAVLNCLVVSEPTSIAIPNLPSNLSITASKLYTPYKETS